MSDIRLPVGVEILGVEILGVEILGVEILGIASRSNDQVSRRLGVRRCS
jgi:hypothetical protein